MAGIEKLAELLQQLADNGFTIKVGDIEIGAVELKDALSDERVTVASGALKVDASGFSIPAGSGVSTSDRQDSANKLLLDVFTRMSDGNQKIQIVDHSGNVLGQIESTQGVAKSVNFSPNQTNQSIWAPSSGKRFVLTDIYVSASGAGQINIFDESNTLANRISLLSMGANGRWDHSYTKPRKSSAVNNNLRYTTDATASGSITTFGYEE